MNFDETPVIDGQAVAEEQPVPAAAPAPEPAGKPSKFCSRCGGKIDEKAVVCPLCGCQVEQIAPATPNIVINNANNNVNTNTQTQVQTLSAAQLKKPKNKWVALLLCFFLGCFGGHKFYEGKIAMGVLYLFTGGVFFIGVVLDFILLLLKPNPYYV